MTLSTNRVVNVAINMSPVAAQKRGFGTLCVLGDSAVMGANEVIRFYNDADSVVGDFGAEAPESLCARAYFAQTPKPTKLAVACWHNAATPASLIGGTPEALEQLKVADGSFKLTIESGVVEVTALDTQKAVSLEAVASLITAKLQGKAKCTVVDGRFVITTVKTGTTAKITVAQAGTDGTDLSTKLALTVAKGAKVVEGKTETETIEQSLARLLLKNGRDFYGLVLATKQKANDDQIVAVAQAIEGSKDAHVFGVTINDPAIKAKAYSQDEQDLASKLKHGGFARTCVFYADFVEGDSAYTMNKYLAASALGRMFTVNFEGANSTITLKFKQAPTIQATNLDATEAKNLQDRNVNIYSMYDTGVYIIEEGIMANGMFADERHGLDWLQDAVQTAVFNTLYQSKKIPQTKSGIAVIKAAIEGVLTQAVTNGLVAPGTWNAEGFGDLEYGAYLPAGFYVWAVPLEQQDTADREARKCPPFTCAVKLAGAIHSADITLNINR